MPHNLTLSQLLAQHRGPTLSDLLKEEEEKKKEPRTFLSGLSDVGRFVASDIKEGYGGLADLVYSYSAPGMVRKLLAKESPLSLQQVPGDLRESIGTEREAAAEAIKDLPPRAQAGAHVASFFGDPVNLLGAGTLTKGAKFARKLLGKADDVAEVVAKATAGAAPKARPVVDEALRTLQKESLQLAPDIPPNLVPFPSDPLRKRMSTLSKSAGKEPEDILTGGGKPDITRAEFGFQFTSKNLPDLPDDARNSLSEIVAKHIDEFQKQRGGVVHLSELAAAPEELAAKVGKSVDDWLSTPRGKALNHEEQLALSATFEGIAKKTSDLTRRVRAGQASDLERAELAILNDEFVGLFKTLVGASSEAGRSLRARQQAIKALSDPHAIFRAQVARKYGSKLSDEAIEKLASLDPDNPEEVLAMMRMVNKPKLGEFVHEAFYAAILSGPATHMRNIIGNTLFLGAEIPVRLVSPGMDIAAQKFSKLVRGVDPGRSVYLDEVVPFVQGALHGIPQGFGKALRVLKEGYDPEMAGKYMERAGAFQRAESPITRGTGSAITLPLRALSAADSFFSMTAFEAQRYAVATRKAIQTLGKDDPARLASKITELLEDGDVVREAGRFARRATYRSDMTRFGRAIESAATSVDVKGIRPGKFILPFVRIMDRLTAEGVNFTPFGLVKAARTTGADRADALARSTMGTGFMASLASLYAQGRVSGSPPKDPTKSAALYATGWKPFSVKVGDTWYPFQQMDILSVPIAGAGTMMELMQRALGVFTAVSEGEADETLLDDLISESSKAFLMIADKTQMSGFADFYESVLMGETNPQRAKRFIGRQVSGMVPYSSLLRSVATAQDPELMKPQTIGENVQEVIPRAVGEAAGIPHRGELPSRLDPLGKEIVPSPGRYRSFLPGGTPFAPSKETGDPLWKEAQNLGVSIGFVGKSIGGVELNRAQRDEYQRLAGELTDKNLRILIGSPSYQMAPKMNRLLAWKEIERVSRAEARARLSQKVFQQRRASLPPV